MNRIEKRFNELKANNEKALILFITAGDPSLEETLNIMEAMAQNGVDCIELGIPFSDPIADGPVIQRSTARALRNRVQLKDILNLVTVFRQNYATPVVAMGYLNPVIRFGEERFIREFSRAGGDGLIIADLPYEEGEEYEILCKNHNTSLIYLLAPEIGTARTKNILGASSGFVYCVSHYGITGTGAALSANLKHISRSLGQLTSLPLAIGFGISSDKTAREMSRYFNGIIIGSWLIEELERSTNKPETAAQFARRLKRAISAEQPLKTRETEIR